MEDYKDYTTNIKITMLFRGTAIIQTSFQSMLVILGVGMG